MMIGPAPIIRMLFMSVRFGINSGTRYEVRESRGSGLHALTSLVPRVSSLVPSFSDRGRACIRPMKRSNRGKTSCGPGLASGWPWKQNAGRSVRASPCTEPSKSEHGVIGAVMAEFHFYRARAGGEPEELMPEADAEDGQAGVHDCANRRDCIVAGLGVAGSVRQKHTVGLHPQNLLGRGLGRHDGQPATARGEHPQNVALDAVVIGDNVKARVFLLPMAPAE